MKFKNLPYLSVSETSLIEQRLEEIDQIFDEYEELDEDVADNLEAEISYYIDILKDSISATKKKNNMPKKGISPLIKCG